MISVPNAERRTKRRTNGRRKQRWRWPKRRQTSSILRFSPYAWAKLLYLRDLGDTEVGGFAVSRADDLLLVEDVRLVRQRCSAVSVEFDDAAVADFFDEQVDAGRPLAAFARIWLHTHPGNSPRPSITDEETFRRCFGAADWAVMFVLARGGDTYARLRFSVGPGGEAEIPVDIDFSRPFAASDQAAWEQEYRQAVKPIELRLAGFVGAPRYLTDPQEPDGVAWPPDGQQDASAQQQLALEELPW